MFRTNAFPSLVLITMGLMDCVTTVVGILYYGAVELNPILTGVVNANLTAFIALKLTSTVVVALIFRQAGKITPLLKIGLPKGHKNNIYGCYTAKNTTISVLNSDILGNPFVILHEFYHHLRSKSVDKQHKGTEKNANKFAIDFIREYEETAKKARDSF